MIAQPNLLCRRPVVVTVQYSSPPIHSLSPQDEKNQLLVTNIWLKLEWNDMNLRWNSSEYGNIRDLRIPPHRIWKPDVLMYNRSVARAEVVEGGNLIRCFNLGPLSADEGFDGTYPTNVVVRSNGSCLYVPPGIFKSTCKIDITWFPFDDQRCEMKFGSWTYDGDQVRSTINFRNLGRRGRNGRKILKSSACAWWIAF